MKKYFALILTVSMFAGLLAGCGSDSDAEYLKDLTADKFVTLGQYKALEISISAPVVTDEDLEETMESIRLNYPMPSPIVGPCEYGDDVIIDYVGTFDGVPFDGGSAEDFPYNMGSYMFIPDLEEGMLGMSLGDVWDIPVFFPDNYRTAEYAGREANFRVTMHSIERPAVVPEITAEYVIWFTEGAYTNVADFREIMRENLIYEVEMAYENELMMQLSMAVLADAEFKTMPAAMVARISNALTATMSYYASMYSLDLETYMMLTGMTDGDITAEAVIAEQAVETTKHYMAFQAIADAEGLKVTDVEVNSAIAELAAAAETPVEVYKAGMDIDSYKEYLMIDKVTQFLVEHAVIVHI